MIQFLLRLTFIFNLILVIFLSSCSSEYHVSDEYKESIRDRKTSRRTVLYILIDGLQLKMLSEELNQGSLPHLDDFYIKGKDQFFVARTVFPSETYPAITSLLTESPVSQHGVYGNQIIREDEHLNFEDPVRFSDLNNMIKNKNIFSRLESKGLKTVSLDYSFNSGSTAHMFTNDADAALAILNRDYQFVDGRLIGSLQKLLEKSKPEDWPDFIYLHLVGVDFTSHDLGPQAQEVKAYLKFLDKKLSPVFTILNSAEKKHSRKVVSLLSSDHGFDKNTSKVIPFSEILEKSGDDFDFLNEERFGALRLRGNWSDARKENLIRFIEAQSDLDIVASYSENHVHVHSQKLDTEFAFKPATNCGKDPFQISFLKSQDVSPGEAVCPGDLKGAENNLYYPFFISNLSRYFQASFHPDIVIIPKPGVSFLNRNRGQHGGPTPGEIFVPLLIHNATLSDPNHIPGLWELLGFM